MVTTKDPNSKLQITTFKKQGKTCPVCGTNDHRCASNNNPDTDRELIFCYTHADARKGEKINGHVCIVPNANHVAGFVRDNAKTKKLTPEEYRSQKQKQAEAKARAAEALRQELAARDDFDTRDRTHRKMIAELGLKPRHYELLRRKGLTEAQIENIGFRSVEQYQEFSFKLSFGTPGRHSEKKNQLTNQAGILYPIRDVLGRFVGFQNRLDDSSNGKYHTISNQKNGKSINSKEFNEIPLTFAYPSELRNNTIFICEGTALKPDIAAEKLGGVVVGASGGLLSSSPETFKYYLQTYDKLLAAGDGLIQKILAGKEIGALGQRRFCLVPDAGAFVNEQVKTTFENNRDLLIELFGAETIDVAHWNHLFQKDAGDIDETSFIPQILTLEEFKIRFGFAFNDDNEDDDEYDDGYDEYEYEDEVAEASEAVEQHPSGVGFGNGDKVPAKAKARAKRTPSQEAVRYDIKITISNPSRLDTQRPFKIAYCELAQAKAVAGAYANCFVVAATDCKFNHNKVSNQLESFRQDLNTIIKVLVGDKESTSCKREKEVLELINQNEDLATFVASVKKQVLAIKKSGLKPEYQQEEIDDAIEPLLPTNIIIPEPGWATNKDKFFPLKALLSEITANTYVADWWQVTESSDSFTDLANKGVNPNWITLDFFENKRYKAAFHRNYRTWAERRVAFAADITQREKYLSIPEEFLNAEDTILVVRKAIKGGKTEALLNFLNKLQGKPLALMLSDRNALTYNTLNRGLEKDISASHVKEMSQSPFKKSDLRLVAGCVNSYRLFQNAEEYIPHDYLINYIDEVESFIPYLASGSTLGKDQEKAIAYTEELINKSKLTIVADANVNNSRVEQIRAKFPNKKVVTLHSLPALGQVVERRDFRFLNTTTKQGDLTRTAVKPEALLIQKSKEFDCFCYISDSQRACEKAEVLFKKRGLKTYRYDAKTSSEKEGKTFAKNPAKYVKDNNIDVLLISPSAESGFSIDLYDYFEVNFWDIKGVLGVNCLIQHSGRPRDFAATTFVSCPSFSEHDCDEALVRHPATVLGSRTAALLRMTQCLDQEINYKKLSEVLHQVVAETLENYWWQLNLEEHRRLLYEKENLRLCLITALQQDGHNVVELIEQVDGKVEDDLKIAKDVVIYKQAEKIYKSPDWSWDKAVAKSKEDLNYDDTCSLDKAKLVHDLPGLLDTKEWAQSGIELLKTVTVDTATKGLHRKLWKLKLLLEPELYNAQLLKNYEYSFEHGFKAKDFNRSDLFMVSQLRDLGIDKLIQKGSFQSSDPEVQAAAIEFHKPENAERVYALTGIKPGKIYTESEDDTETLDLDSKAVTAWFKRVLKFFGLQLLRDKKNDKTISYKIIESRKFEYENPDAAESLEAPEFLSFAPVIKKLQENKKKRLLDEVANRSLIQSFERAGRSLALKLWLRVPCVFLETIKCFSQQSQGTLTSLEKARRKLDAVLAQPVKLGRAIAEIATEHGKEFLNEVLNPLGVDFHHDQLAYVRQCVTIFKAKLTDGDIAQKAARNYDWLMVTGGRNLKDLIDA